MPPTTIRTPPSLGDYTTLEEFQSQTPESFVGGKPILHCHLSGAKATIPQSQGGTLAVFPADAAPATSNGINGGSDSEPTIERVVDVFVTSENFTIFSQDAEAGVSIPYPSISIHAVKHIEPEANAQRSQVVWMQLEFSDGGHDDDDFHCVELTISPPASSDTEASPAVQLYEAIAACSNLHPDPHAEGGDEEADEYDRIIFEGGVDNEPVEGFSGVLQGAADGSLPPPMPGSGGWITAENVHEYFDEDGNWRGGEGDAQEGAGDATNGAGRTRGHDEIDGVDDTNGQDGEETKRPRVD